MADYTIASNQRGAYEFALPAGQEVAVDIASPPYVRGYRVQVIHHTGTKPLYFDEQAFAADNLGAAQIVMPSSWINYDIADRPGGRCTLHLRSGADAVASVTRI